MNNIEQGNSEKQVDSPLQLETSVIKENKDINQSVTDLYGVNVFTADFTEQIEKYKINGSDILAQKKVFTNQSMNIQDNQAIENYLFQTSSSVLEEDSSVNNSDMKGYYILGFGMTLFIFFVLSYFYQTIRRKNKNDSYNIKNFIRK